MSSSSSKPPPPHPHLRLHVDSTSTGTTATNAPTAASASSSRASRSAIVLGGGGGSGQQNQACAACKYQRRKCNPDCPLAPYFPADQQRLFLNAHRLFGVSNIQKTLRRIDDPVKCPEAMWTLIYQSEARAADPVHGCVSVINTLREQIRDAEIELQHVRQQIDVYRQAAAAGGAGAIAHPPMILTDAAAAVAADALPPGNVVDAFYAAGGGSMQGFPGLLLQQQGDHQPPPQQLYNYFCYDDEGGDETSSSHGFADATARQMEAVQPFTGAFDVKPQALPATTIEHHAGPANDDDMDVHAGHNKMARVMLKHGDDVDHHMEEKPAATTPAPCHLELGFSSY